MIRFLIVTQTITCTVVVVALLVAHYSSLLHQRRVDAAVRSEREMLTRALLARSVPEFAALEKIVANGHRPRPVVEELEVRDPDVPLVPEGL